MSETLSDFNVGGSVFKEIVDEFIDELRRE